MPLVCANNSPTVPGLMLHAFCAVWQVEQDRPLVPCGWKYSPVRSTKPRVENVVEIPFGLRQKRQEIRPASGTDAGGRRQAGHERHRHDRHRYVSTENRPTCLQHRTFLQLPVTGFQAVGRSAE